MVGPALVVVAYLLGSISFGLVAAKRAGIDLRAVGSGNIGATNVGRALGKGTGRAVMLLDALKGVVPVLAARLLLPADEWWMGGVAVAAVLGHLAPIWHGFRGGKGVATTAGVMLVAVPAAGLAMAVTYGVLRKSTKRSSVGSLAGTLVAVAVTAALRSGTPWRDGPDAPRALLATAAAIAVMVFVRHASNIRRLLRGEELPS
ncbi:MAG: glycerol-3-phosphate 1-O-acyltransferase PlsY [Polyangiaceae bacterium]